MPEISLTSFVDFVSKSGRPKLTVVRMTKKQLDEGYSPQKDFYKKIREAIVAVEREGGSLGDLNRLLPGLNDRRKADSFPIIIRGYRKWRPQRGLQWLEPAQETWRQDDLTVKVNPELGLSVRGLPHLIKLYFKADKLSKQRIDIVTHLMKVACRDRVSEDCVMGVLDTRRSRLITPTVPIEGLDTLLKGEAAYWSTVWEELE